MDAREIKCKTTMQRPVRDPNSAYYVSEELYPFEKYPSYCTTYFMIFGSEAVTDLIEAYDNLEADKIIHLYGVFIGVMSAANDFSPINGFNLNIILLTEC